MQLSRVWLVGWGVLDCVTHQHAPTGKGYPSAQTGRYAKNHENKRDFIWKSKELANKLLEQKFEETILKQKCQTFEDRNQKTLVQKFRMGKGELMKGMFSKKKEILPEKMDNPMM
jgi:hypothetical protein